MIEHLHNADIDKAWWDAQLATCGNRNWYAFSRVLGIASPGWNAMVDRESGAVMPLTWRSKFGIRYLHQPFGLQQLGVFAPVYTDAIGNALLAAVPRLYGYWDIYLNEAMQAVEIGDTTSCQQQVVPIAPTVDEQRAGYGQGHQRNLRKAEAHRPLLTWEVTPDEFVALFGATTGERFAVPVLDMRMIADLISMAVKVGEARILGLREYGVLCAAACFVEHGGRSILLKSAVSKRGQELQAMFLIIDGYLTSGAGGSALLDFAGSNTPSVARFYAGFGARTSVYSRLLRNRLPRPLRWYKQRTDGA